MQLLNPIGLLAAAGILVPLLIHLWKVKQGETLKIGSITLLGESAQQSAKSLKITDWLLLLLRCLLLFLLALILAQPYLEKKEDKAGVKGWILMEKVQLPLVYQNNRLIIDSLLNTGYELHEFDFGFKQMSLKDTLASNISIDHPAIDYASLLKQLNTVLAAGFPVVIYRDVRLNQMSNTLPAVAFDLKFQDLPLTDTLSHWITIFSGKSYEANSSPSLTWYKSLKQKKLPKVSILVHENGYPADLTYLKAAVAAIGDFTHREIEFNVWNKQNFRIFNPDLVLWLADQDLDPLLKKSWKKGARLFTYEKGKVQTLHSIIDFQQEGLGNGAAIVLNKRIVANSVKEESIWTDGFGDPILSIEKKPELDHYYFYTRLNPQWTDLVLEERFVKVFMPVILGRGGAFSEFGFEDHANDQRRMANNQAMSVPGQKISTTKPVNAKEPIGSWIWTFAWMVFVLERILSVQHQKKNNDGLKILNHD